MPACEFCHCSLSHHTNGNSPLIGLLACHVVSSHNRALECTTNFSRLPPCTRTLLCVVAFGVTVGVIFSACCIFIFTTCAPCCLRCASLLLPLFPFTLTPLNLIHNSPLTLWFGLVGVLFKLVDGIGCDVRPQWVVASGALGVVCGLALLLLAVLAFALLLVCALPLLRA